MLNTNAFRLFNRNFHSIGKSMAKKQALLKIVYENNFYKYFLFLLICGLASKYLKEFLIHIYLQKN